MRTVNQRHTRAVGASLAYTVKVAVKEVVATNLQALLNHLGGELVHTVFRGEAENVVDGTSTVRRAAVLADVLDAPITELTMSNDINAGKNFVDARALQSNVSHGIRRRSVQSSYLVFFETILKDVLDNKAASFT